MGNREGITVATAPFCRRLRLAGAHGGYEPRCQLAR
jgi:hypothetical protein